MSRYYSTSNNSKMVGYKTALYFQWPTNRKSWSIELCHCQWPWMIPNPDIKVTPLFNADYVRNCMRYRYSYNEILIGTYAVLKSVISNDLEWLVKYSVTRSIARFLSDCWASCTNLTRCVKHTKITFTYSPWTSRFWYHVNFYPRDAYA